MPGQFLLASMVLIALPCFAQAPLFPWTALYLDHIVIATALPDSLAIDFDQLGFSSRPGRLHRNSIYNVFIEFANQTEIELLTATKDHDALSAYYRNAIDRSPAGSGQFVCLRTADELGWRRLTSWLDAFRPDHQKSESGYAEIRSFPGGHSLNPIFFIRYKKPPKRHDVIHNNGSKGLVSVWLCLPESWKNLLPAGSHIDTLQDRQWGSGNYQNIMLAGGQSLNISSACGESERITGVSILRDLETDSTGMANKKTTTGEQRVKLIKTGGIYLEFVPVNH